MLIIHLGGRILAVIYKCTVQSLKWTISNKLAIAIQLKKKAASNEF